MIARRDFTAIVFSKVFLLFLIGPLFFLAISAGGGYVGGMAASGISDPELGLAMSAQDNAAAKEAGDALDPLVGMPDLAVIDDPDAASPQDLLDDEDRNLFAVLTGSLEDPLLTGPKEDVERWEGEVAMLSLIHI